MDCSSADALTQLKTALDIYQAQYIATDKLWTYFSSVTLGVVGFSIASDKVGKSPLEASIVAVAYLLFCFGNHLALRPSQEMLVQFAQLARTVAQKSNLPMPSIGSLSVCLVMTFHAGISLAVAAAIIWIARSRALSSRNPSLDEAV